MFSFLSQNCLRFRWMMFWIDGILGGRCFGWMVLWMNGVFGGWCFGWMVCDVTTGGDLALGLGGPKSFC